MLFNGGKTYWEEANGQNINVYRKILPRGGCLLLPRGYMGVHVYSHDIRFNTDGNIPSKTYYVASLGSGKEKLYKWSRSPDQDGRHHYRKKSLKILFSRDIEIWSGVSGNGAPQDLYKSLPLLVKCYLMGKTY